MGTLQISVYVETLQQFYFLVNILRHLAMDVKEKVVVITGSAMGLGKAFAVRLLQDGAKVCISDVNEEVGLSTLKELGQRFGEQNVHFIKCNVTNREELEALYDGCETHFKEKVDIFCNNAGVNPSVGWKLLMDINIIAVMEGTYMAMEKMDASKGGKGGLIVNTASVAGLVCPPQNTPNGIKASKQNSYFASKHAVVGLTKSLANKEVLKESGVKLQCICPFFADTNIINNLMEAGDTGESIKKEFGLMSPEFVAEAFHSMVTGGENGEVLVVVKGAPAIAFPNLNLMLVYALAAGGKLFGVKVVRHQHQVAFAVLIIVFIHIILSLLLKIIF